MGFCLSRVFDVEGDTSYVRVEKCFDWELTRLYGAYSIFGNGGNGASCVPSDMVGY